MTRIASVATHMISVPRPQPVWTAHEESKAWNVILTEVRTDDGLVGYGEIHGAPMPRICEWVSRFGEIIRGMDALAHIAVWEKLFALTSPRPGGIDGRDGLPPPVPRGERAQVMAAIAGIDIALVGHQGESRRPAGVPAARRREPADLHLCDRRLLPAGCVRRGLRRGAGAVLDLGYRAVKLKTGAGTVAEEAKRIGAVRRAIGDEPLLMLDMNAAYDLPDCIEFAHAVEPHRIFWLEEPLHWYLQPADFARLAAATPIPLAHGERELTRFTVRDFIVEGGIRYVQFDATRAAGFTEASADRPARRAARGNARPAYRPRTARPSGARRAALRLRGRVAWRAGDRPTGFWPLPRAPRIARRSPACSATNPALVSRSTGPLSTSTACEVRATSPRRSPSIAAAVRRSEGRREPRHPSFPCRDRPRSRDDRRG